MGRLSSEFDEFDKEDPAIQEEMKRIKRHSDCADGEHKYWLDTGFVGMGELAIVYAPPGSGKSVFSIDMACRCAAGLNWDGSPMWRPQNVLYIATERGGQVKRRVDAYCRHHGIERFSNLLIRDSLIDLGEPEELMTAVRAAQLLAGEDSLDLVVIDTLANGLSGSDSNPEVMARAVRSIMRALLTGNFDGGGPSFVVVHHTPKDNSRQLRGASQLLAATDTTILLSKKRGTFTAEVVKTNDTPDQPKRHFKLATVSFGKNEDGIETTAPVAIPCDPPKASNGNDPDDMTASAKAQLAILRSAIEACNGPVTLDQWREAVFAAAGDIKDGSKRVRFSRAKTAIEDYIVEEEGLFSIKEGVS